MSNSKKLWIGMVVCFILLVGVGCGKTQDQADQVDISNQQIIEDEGEAQKQEPQRGGKITIPMRKPKSLHPILNTDKTVDQTLKLVFDTLIDFDENNRVVGNIAKSWTMGEEGSVLDIELNDGIKWHDGRDLTADDVVFSLKIIQEAQESPYKPCVRNIISYEALSDREIRIVYKERFSGYAATLYFPIIPAHIDNLGSQLIGSGPYELESSLPNKQLNLKGNPLYFKGEPNIATIEVLFTPDPESDLYSFDQEIIDVVSTDVIDWEKYAKNKKSTIHEYTTMYYDYIGLNFNKALLQNLQTRQALLYATNREYLLENIYLYHGEISDVPVAPFSWLYEAESKQYESDIEKAKQLLDGETIDLELLVSKDNSQRKKVAYALQKMYKDIGINLEVVELDSEVFMERVKSGQYEMFLGGWNLSIIPDLSFAFHSANLVGGANYGAYVSNDMDQLLQEAFAAKSEEDLKGAYSKIQMHISEHLPYLSLYFRTSALITNEKIKGNIKPHHMNVYQNIHEWYIQ